MRLPDLERELARAGYTFARQGGTTHRVYRHEASGHSLTITRKCGHSGTQYSRPEIHDIWRSVERQRQQRKRTEH
jgi:predicted RNA binding protein YcfA (HicA-like mRNA interferase family)